MVCPKFYYKQASIVKKKLRDDFHAPPKIRIDAGTRIGQKQLHRVNAQLQNNADTSSAAGANKPSRV
jgi:hypothetical protein